MTAAPPPTYADPQVYRDLAGFEGDWRDTWWNADFLQLLGRRFGLGARNRALDVGCGAGHWGQACVPLLAPDATLIGLDHEAQFVEMARARAQERGLAGCSYLRANAQQLPFPDGSFDLVTAQTVLIHVPDAAKVTAEMTRVLRPGGCLLLVEPDNVATTASFFNTSIALDPEDMLQLLRLQLICERGKVSLGEGDGSIGARLPALLAAAGLGGIQVYGSDKCAAQMPPYDDAAQAIDLREQLRFCKDNVWLQTGTQIDSRRHFLAGGGDEAVFDTAWRVACAWMRAFEAQVQARTFSAARGVAMVVAGGTRGG